MRNSARSDPFNPKEKVLLRELSLRVRSLTAIAGWFSFIVAIFFSGSHYVIAIAAISMILISLIGFYGATPKRYPPRFRDPPFEIEESYLGYYRMGLYVWLALLAVYIIIYLSLKTLNPIAEDRCSPNNNLFVELYGDNCGQDFAACEDECKYQVKLHLFIEIIALYLAGVVALMYVDGQADKLLTTKMDMEAGDFEDEED